MISIIIPAYNEEKYIARALESIKKQTFSDYEVLVVANGCTDRTADVARKYRCSVITTNLPHTSKARNLGAQRATADILLFLDADTQLAPHALEQVQKEFHGFAVGTMRGKPNTAKLRYRLLMSVQNFLHATRLYTGSAGTIITRADLFRKVGGFDDFTIKENSRLITKLKRFGKYGVIPGTYVTISTRRYERWGLLRLFWFWAINGAKLLVFDRDAEYEAVR